MDSYCSDINTIFAFVDISHKFHDVVSKHFNSIKDNRYVLLKHVKTKFVFTYNDNLKRVGEIILATINRVKEQLNKRRLKKPPSDIIKNVYLKLEMTKLIKEYQGKELSPTDYDYYRNILLNKFPLIELLNDENKLGEFDSTYINQAEEIVNDKINEFVSFFKNIEKSPKLNPKNVRKNYLEIKDIKKENILIFTDPDDEDIWLSSEYITYCEDRKILLNFSSTDKNLVSSLNFVVKQNKIKCGKIVFLLSKYSFSS